MLHLGGHAGVGGQGVHAGEALGAQAGEVVGGADVRVQAEVNGDALDGEGEAAQLAGDLARGGGVRGGGGGGPVAAGLDLVVLDEAGGVVLGEGVHSDEGEGFLARGGELLRPLAGGGDDAQPVLLRDEGKLGLGEQGGFGDVVEEDEGGGALVGIAVLHGGGAAFQLGQHAASAGLGGFVGAGGEGDFQPGAEFAEQREDFLSSLRAEHPEAGGIGIGPAVGVGGGEFGLALPAEAMHGGDDADGAEGEVFVKLAQLGLAADEVGIDAAEIAGRTGGAAGALDALPQAGAEGGELFAHGGLAQGLGAVGKPRLEIHPVRAAERAFVPGLPPLLPGRAVGGRDDPARDGLGPRGVELLVAVGRFHEIHGRDAFVAHEGVDLALEILLPFPEAGRTFEVIRREADEENPALTQAGEDAVAPVVHVFDLGRVEENAQRLGGEAAVVGEDFVVEGGDPALGWRIGDCGWRIGRQRARDVVFPRVGDEKLVGHGGRRLGRRARRRQDLFAPAPSKNRAFPCDATSCRVRAACENTRFTS